MTDFAAAKAQLEKAQQAYNDAIEGRKQEIVAKKAELTKDHNAVIADLDKELAELGGSISAPTGQRRKGVKTGLLNLITENGSMTRGQIIETYGAKGDKSLTGSVSNALSNLKKEGKINLNDGHYSIAS